MNVIAQILTLAGIVATALLVSGVRPVFLIAAYGALALAALVGWSPKRHAGLSPRVVPCLAASGVFFGYILVRILSSPVEYIAREDLYMVLGALIVYLITVFCATSPASRVAFTGVLLLLACGQVLVGAIQFSKGNDFMPFEFLARSEYPNRACGFYGCPNHLAGFLEIALPLALSFTFWSRWRLPWKIVAGYVAIVCGVGLILTGSRGGYVSVAVGLFVFAVLSLALARHWMWREVWLLLVTVLVLAVIGIGFMAYAGLHSSEALTHRVNSTGGDAPVRLGYWNAALHQFEVSPIFGTGSRTYLYYGRLFREPGPQRDPIFAHSDVLQLAAEFGLVAFVGLAAFLFYHVRSGLKFIADVIARRTIEGERDAPGFHGDNSLALTTGALCGVAALLAHSFVDFNLHIPTNTLVMAFVFGMLANPFSALVPEANSGSAQARALLRWAVLALPALGMWLAGAALPKWPAEKLADKANTLLSDWRFLEQPEVARDAASLARQALDRDPKNTGMWKALGDSCVALAEMEANPAGAQEPYRQAIEAYQRGLQIAPLDVHFVVALAGIYDALGRFDEAESYHRRALKMDGNSGDIRWAYGNHFHLQGKLDEADEQFVRAGNHHGADAGRARIREQRKALVPPTAH